MSELAQDQEIPPALFPFDWTKAGHALVKAGEEVDWRLDDPDELEKFAKRVQSIEYGLSAEVEFAAILSWLGRCPLVHRLDQDYFSSDSKATQSIPDLLAVLESGGIRVPVLIEVKTRNSERLSLPTSELVSMQQYAAELKLPLLIAWKPRRLGFWLLVDPVHCVEQGGKSVLELEPAMTSDLMSSVGGDFLVIPKQGAGLFFESRIVKKTRTGKNGFEGIAQLEKCEFRDANGTPAKNIPAGILAVMFSRMDVEDEVMDTRICKKFVTTGESVHAQQVLRTAVALKPNKSNPIKWRHVAKDMESFLSRDELNATIGQYFGTFIQYHLFQVPEVWPSWIPEAWKPKLPDKLV